MDEGDDRAHHKEVIALPAPLSVMHVNGPAQMIAIGVDEAIIVSNDGRLMMATFEELNVDWRYDWRLQTWVDVGPSSEGEYGSPEEEETNDGGEEVSGSLSDAYRTDRSDPGDGEDGAPGSLDSGEEN